MNSDNKNIKKSAVEKRRETILRKRQRKAEHKEAYHAKHGLKHEAKAILNAGAEYSKAKDSFIKMRNFYITASLNVKLYFSKDRSSYTKEYKEAKNIKAKSQSDAIQEYRDILENKYNYETSRTLSEIIKVKFQVNITVDSRPETIQTLSSVKMRNATQLNYDHIPEEKFFLQNTGYCVIDNLVGVYSEKLKIGRDKIIDMAKTYYECNEEPDWKPEDGLCPNFINMFCKAYDISHYAVNFNNSIFQKNISKHRNLPALYYYSVDQHMYLIKDSELCKTLTKKAIDKNINTSMVESDSVNIFEKFEIYENVAVEDIKNYESCIIIYSRVKETNINDIFLKVIEIYNKIPSNIRSSKTNINRFSFKINKNIYYIVIDPNDLTVGIKWSDIKQYCSRYNIEFTNQTFTSFIKQLRDIQIKEERKQFTEVDRLNIYNKYKSKCNHCKCNVEINNLHIDHIRPLSNGGTNDIENLQILCKSCHKIKCENEIEDGSYIRVIDTESSFNSRINDIINSEMAQSYAFIERIVDATIKKNIFTVDINKCRTNILYHNDESFCVFSVLDDVKPFTGDNIEAGLYFIKSTNTFPLRGNGWYYHPMVKYCLEQKLISLEDIKYVIKSSQSIPMKYYNKFIDYCKVEFGEHAKLAINSMIGAFKPNPNNFSSWNTVDIVRSSSLAFQELLNNDGCFVDVYKINNDNIYHVYKEVDNIKIETESPLYNQIVQIENIEIHKLYNIIIENGGSVLDLNTDAISCTFQNNILPFALFNDGTSNIADFLYPDGTPKYKLEKKERLQYPKMQGLKRDDIYQYKIPKYNVISDVEDNNFAPLVNTIISSNKSIHIDGAAGCGKSYLIKQLQQQLDINNKRYITLAPTNKACNIVNGMTLHKYAAKLKKKSHLINHLNEIDYLFVDEISMVKEMFYKFMLLIKKLNTNIKFIITGDFNQLLPVNDRVQDVDYKNSYALYELCDGNRLQLSKCRRADDTLFNMCKFDNIMNVDTSVLGSKPTDRNICYTNRKRIKINNDIMIEKYKKRKPKQGQFIKLEKLWYDDNSQDVILISQTPIIARCSYKDDNIKIANNEMFYIDKVNYNRITVKNDKRKFIISGDMFQKLFYVAYAITTHKSQGETFNEPYTIHEWQHMDERLRYVALTRATTIENINIM